MVRARWTNEDFARGLAWLVTNVIAKLLAELLVDPGHLKDRAVQHRGEPRLPQRAKDFLCLAE